MIRLLGRENVFETRGGIWRYDANKPGQVFSPKERYATGIRNADGIAIDSTGLGLFATQHGRDELSENWPGLYKPEQGANLPAEEVLRVEQGADYGWPECYYDDIQQKLVLAPEYGGDGGKAVGVCADKKGPVLPSRPIGRRTICCSTVANNSRRPIVVAPSSPSTDRGIARHSRKAGTTSCSSRSQTAKLPASSSSLPTALPEATRILAKPPTGHPALRPDLTARSISPMTSTAVSGA